MGVGPELVTYPQVTRIEVIDNEGRRFVQYYSAGASAVLQDDGRTLKIFAGERQLKSGAQG